MFLIAGLLAAAGAGPALAAPCAGSDVQGSAFHDYDADGARSASNVEAGISGVVITVFSADGSSASCETLADGSFGIDAPAGGFPVRFEATLPGGGLFDSLEPGAAGQTTVSFVPAAASGIDIGFNVPVDYCQTNPDVMTTCFLTGDPLFPGSLAATGDTVISVDYDRTTPTAHLAIGSEVGSVWGVAYQKSSQKLFAAAVLKRHAGFGPLGLGGIYQLDYSGGSPPAVSNFVDVSTLGIPVGTDPRSVAGEDPPGCCTTGNEPGLDNLTYEEVGKVGLGDIDVEEEAGRLWVMSLSDATLYSLDIGAAGTVPGSATGFPLPAVACTDGVFRPWAVKSHRGRIYVGGVCSNEDISPYPAPPMPGGFIDYPNLVGFVYSMDSGGGPFSLELTVPLNYPKGCSIGTVGCQWNPWTDLTTETQVLGGTGGPTHATPILSDIEFADDGDMIVGFTDRTGFQYGTDSPPPNTTPADMSIITVFAGGDMLRADLDPGTGVWTLESNGIAGGVVGAGSGNGEGPGGGEYYSSSLGTVHHEQSLGGYAVLRGSGHFVTSSMDPVIINSGGLLWMHDLGATPGARFAGHTLYVNPDPPTFAKGVGIGDVELRCDPAPVEIGNRVWLDDDLDGIQDPGEAPIAGVTVNLSCGGGATTATTLTDAAGQYLFNDANVAGGLVPGESCTVRLDHPADHGAGGPLEGLVPVPADQGSDLHDSDATLVAGFPEVGVTIGGVGANNHTYDFGLAVPQADLIVSKSSSPNPVRPGGLLTYTVTVDNAGPSDAHNVMATDMLPGSVTFQSTVGCANDPVGVPVCDLGTIPAGGSAQYAILVTVDPDGPLGDIVNQVSVMSDTGDPIPANDADTETTTLQASTIDIPTLGPAGLAFLAAMIVLAGSRFLRRI